MLLVGKYLHRECMIIFERSNNSILQTDNNDEVPT